VNDFPYIFYITIEAVRAQPDDNLNTFLRWNRMTTNTNTATTCPTLLCYDDSLTHGKHPHGPSQIHFGKVDAGQNSITSHTLLDERFALTLQPIYPNCVLILLGTNDMQATK
jgi:hypothetical protein